MSDAAPDRRNIRTGWVIAGQGVDASVQVGYCDQPYVVVLPDGVWLCLMTTGAGVEGQPGQHVVALRSEDRGRSWSKPIPIEPPDGPEASWVMPLLTPSGRVYAYYVYNTANLREVITDFGPTPRVDTLGDLMCRYSDDGGLTWSAERYRVPIRVFECDRENPYGGEVLFFWGVGKPIVWAGHVYLGLAKVGRFGEGFMARSEGVFLHSDNALTEPDPAQHRWETLPDGDIGLRAPRGPIADEHNLVPLSDGSLYCTYRTIDGHPCAAYSRDGGHTWTPPAYMAYEPGGRLVKHPRAANFVKRFSNGKFLYWFHNHGGRWYDDRNPAWVLGGVEVDGFIHWSQPEILLYDPDPRVRISYPDFFEDDGVVYVTETQKSVARVHALDAQLLEVLWSHRDRRQVCEDGLLLDHVGAGELDAPPLPDLERGGGFSAELWVEFGEPVAGQLLLDARSEDGKGWSVETTAAGTARIRLNDGRTENAWECDRGLLSPGLHHLVVTVDGGPKIITYVIDGQLCDGGDERQFGWGRFSPHLREVNSARVRIGVDVNDRLRRCRIYGRPLLTGEAVGNYRAGL